MGKDKEDSRVTRLHDEDIAKIANLVAAKIRGHLEVEMEPYAIDCASGFRCSMEYQCDGGFTCYSFACQRDFVCEAGNNFVCPQSFNCANAFTRDNDSTAQC